MPEAPIRASGADIEDAYPLTPMQSDMLVHSLSSPHSGAYLEHAVCDLRESLEPAHLEAAWHRVVVRHPILRTSFRIERDAVQEVHRQVDVPWVHLDWRDLPLAEQETRFEAYVEADRQHELAIERSPPMRLALLRLSGAHYRLLWTYHHALLDGRSVRAVLRELFDLYDALAAGGDLALPAPRPYRAYVDWLKRQDAASGAEAFWRNALQGFAPTRLPVERTGSGAGKDEGYAIAELTLARQSTNELQHFATEHGLTLNTLLLGAWAQLLARYSGETDVVFDTTLALRGDRGDALREVVGLCINTVPMCVRVDPQANLLSWLEGLRAQWLAMRAHAWLPLASIHRCRNGSRAAHAMSSLVVFEHAALDTLLHEERKDWTTRAFIHRSRPSHPLTLACFGKPELLLKIAYARSRYEAATIGSMLEHLRNLLEAALTASGRPLYEQALLTPSEQHRALIEWNDTARDFPARSRVHELVAQQSARTPDAVAVESTVGCLTYGELEGRANQLARYLARRGVGREALVGLCLPRTPELVVGLLGILKAGAAYLPLDPSHPPERLEEILRESAVVTVVTTRALALRLGQARERAVLLDVQRDEIARESTASPDARVGPDQLAYVVYTSGSTGRPKGISVHHAALANHTLALAERYAISAADRRLQFVSISSDVLIADVFPVLVSGGAVVLRPDGDLLSVAEFLRFLEARKVTMTGIPSAYWHEWVAAMAAGAAPPLPSSLRVVISGMDSVRLDAFAVWRKRVGKRVRWFNAYGPSETTCTATTYEADLMRDSPLATIPIGRPIANVRIYVMDHYANPVPVGVPGEICICGQGVALGYRNRPDLTAESFVRDPFSSGRGDQLYRTGDLGRYLPDGNIEFLGRADSQIKIRGSRVEPAEVEAALRRLAQIRDAIVVGQGAAGDQRKLVGYVVAVAPGLDADDLRRQLRRSLPDYMVPAVILVLDSLPRTPNGKIDYGALPVPEPAVGDPPGGYEPPRDALERALAKIWQEVLGVARIGIGEHFFDLGGDSLHAMRMLSWVARIQGVEVPLALFFAEATIDGLAGTLRAMSDGEDIARDSCGAVPLGAGIIHRPARELPQSGQPEVES
jgi:amino acid adenylation domain-containing protein